MPTDDYATAARGRCDLVHRVLAAPRTSPLAKRLRIRFSWAFERSSLAGESMANQRTAATLFRRASTSDQAIDFRVKTAGDVVKKAGCMKTDPGRGVVQGTLRKGAAEEEAQMAPLYPRICSGQ